MRKRPMENKKQNKIKSHLTLVKSFQTVLLNKAKTSQVSNDPACTGEAAILQTFIETLNVTLRPPQC